MLGLLSYVLVLVFLQWRRQSFLELPLEKEVGVVLAIYLPLLSVFCWKFLAVEAGPEDVAVGDAFIGIRVLHWPE
jgi:hypothetical protein